jgi:integrase
MRGRIYSDLKCSICNSSFQHEDRRRGLFCPNHPDQQANSRFIVQFGRKLRKRFTDFRSAERFLDGLRYEVDRGTFDSRDYLSSNPLSFTVLSTKYLQKKTDKVKAGTLQNITNYLTVAQEYFGNTNVKSIQFAQLEDFSDTLEVTNKTKSNYLSCLHDFFIWIYKRKEITSVPDFPTISYELGYRKTIDKETQNAILDEIKRISWHVTPKVWIAIKFLCTYISVRPNEMRNLKEKHIDLKQGILFFPHPKEKRPKIVPLIQEDIEMLSQFPIGLPDLYFFRHNKNVKGVKAGTPFGKTILYKWWKKACDNLGVVDVDLYGGTRHSSAIGLRRIATPEQIKMATMHSTNKAFERYFIPDRTEIQGLYEATRECDTGVIRKKPPTITVSG